MTITVSLPDDLLSHADPSRETLEAVALAGYQGGELSAKQARALLAMGRLEFFEFLKAHDVMDHTYGIEQLREDIETGDKLRQSGLIAG